MHYFDIQFTLDCFVANVRPLVPTPLICVRLGSISAVLTEGENLQHGGLRHCTHQRRLSCWIGLLVGDEGGRIRTSLANTDAHIPLSFFCVCVERSSKMPLHSKVSQHALWARMNPWITAQWEKGSLTGTLPSSLRSGESRQTCSSSSVASLSFTQVLKLGDLTLHTMIHARER